MPMHLIGIGIIAAYGLIIAFSLLSNKDVLSPAKIFVGYLLLFHFELTYVEYPLSHYLTFLLYTSIGVFWVLGEYLFISTKSSKNGSIESKIGKGYEGAAGYREYQLSALTTIIWTLSIIPFSAQIYLIADSGGIFNYINDAAYRVTEWRGKGPILILIKMAMVLQIIYFMLGFYWSVKSKVWWALFLSHFLMALSLAALTGSRSVLLMNFVFMLAVYHHTKRRVSIRKILAVGMVLMMVASVLGLARNNLKISEDNFQTGLDKDIPFDARFKTLTSTFRYGLIPLDFIYSHDPKKIQYGASIVTPVTNIIPRGLWPGKIDTSSMAMNKEYLEDLGPGPYQYAAGMIGFGVMNFGWVFGIPFSFALTFFGLAIIESGYFKFIRVNHTGNFISALNALSMIYVMFAFSALIIGEVSNVFLELVLTQLSPLFFIIVCVKIINFEYRRRYL